MDSKQNVPGKDSAAPVGIQSSMPSLGQSGSKGGSVLSAMTIGALVLGLLVGFGAGMLIGHRGGSAPVATTETGGVSGDTTGTLSSDLSSSASSATSDASSTAPAAVSSPSISVSGQTAGKTVTVAHVTLAKDGWVTVNDDVAGQPGNVLGAQWLPAGDHDNVTVDLLRATEPGKSYVITLRDDNGNHKFELNLDTPQKDASGSLVMSTFDAK